MNRIISFIILTILGLGLGMRAYSQEDTRPIRPVHSAYMVQAGHGQLADTYLTPLKYNGINLGFLYERTQAMKFSPDNWIMQLRLGADFESTENPAKNATMVSAELEATWSMMRRWTLPYNINVGIGSATGIAAGALYLSKNGNNPASAKAAWTVDASAYASWRCTVLRIPVLLRYQAYLPVAGAFFSPNYGQLYYQIYLGDTEGLAHAAWWGNYFMLDQMVSADINFGGASLRIGYRGKYFSSKVNHLVTNDISHSLVIGITTDWISLRPGSKLPDSRIINAY